MGYLSFLTILTNLSNFVNNSLQNQTDTQINYCDQTFTIANPAPATSISSIAPIQTSLTFVLFPAVFLSHQEPKVAQTAVSIPIAAPPYTLLPLALNIQAPAKAPDRLRPINPPGFIRSGVFGNLSSISSPAAKSLDSTPKVSDCINFNGELAIFFEGWRFSTWFTTNGAELVRIPAIIPKPRDCQTGFDRFNFMILTFAYNLNNNRSLKIKIFGFYNGFRGHSNAFMGYFDFKRSIFTHGTGGTL
jgi:hypothetical protein